MSRIHGSDLTAEFTTDSDITAVDEGVASGLDRRRFVGYLVAAPTLAVAVRLGGDLLAAPPAAAVIPSPDGPAELLDLTAFLTLAATPTSNLIAMQVRKNGTVHFALPRSENGQGIVTSTAMIIADEMDIPLKRVKVTLADARPELLFNQLTGGSFTTISTYEPIRRAAAIAREELRRAAAERLGRDASSLRTVDGKVVADDGTEIGYGELAEAAAVTETTERTAELKATRDLKIIGKPVGRLDAREIVTGQKKYLLDMKVKGALPTMICRAPTLNGKPERILNRKKVLRMKGVTHVAMISSGVAVRAKTFGQCIDAVRALRVQWSEGTVEGKSDEDILAEVKAVEIPLLVPELEVPGVTSSVEGEFTFWFKSNSALEPNCAIADVRGDSAEVWAGLKTPISAQAEIAQRVGLPQSAVTVHVVQGGGSFGRKLFYDGAVEAAEASKAFGKPVKLMWHRADDSRQGRVHPLATSRIRATVLGNDVLTYEQRHTSIITDYSHGLGEAITALGSELPVGDISFSQTIYLLTQHVHYNFGVTTNLLNELPGLGAFNTGSMRNIYSPDVATAREIMVDKLAEEVGLDPLEFRLKFLRQERQKAVLEKVAQVGNWGRTMPRNTAQGIAIHEEYQGFAACLVEIDARPSTVNRKIREAVTGPRVTKVVFAVDVGLAINPKGLKAQMMGGAMDGIALALTSSMHLRDGYFLEASWDNYAYTRQWNTPPVVEIIVMPSTSDKPGGAGEFGVAATMAATALAYGRATGEMPTEFPINHKDKLHFKVKPQVPPIPPSPRNGLRFAR